MHDQKTLLRLCVFFLGLEERMLIQNRISIANFARRQYDRYRARLEATKHDDHSQNRDQRAHCPG